jgi:hypothetical protein
MLTALIAMLVLQAEPAANAAPPQPEAADTEVRGRKHRMIADGRALLVRAQRLSAAYKPAPGGPTKAEIDASVDQVKSDLDSMSEMGEMESLRLQTAMDRMSKLMATLSNLLKKASDTSQGITQNIK